MFKRALISVSDKTGLCDFLTPHYKKGMEIVSSGGTAKFLQENGFEVTEVSDQTKFPEVMGGRVKTLHPNIHMPILYRGEEDFELLKKFDLKPFDVIIVNLYPFAEAQAKGLTGDDLIEYIDIGGPSLLRGAAKNFKNVSVICDPADYEIINSKSEITLADRKKLAAKVFKFTADYDKMIAESFVQGANTFKIEGELQEELRYGENPHQKAQWFKLSNNPGWHEAKIIQGKTLSYNNLLDLEAAKRTVELFTEPTAVAVKHNNPCGIGTAIDITTALGLCLSADPVSVFGGIVACNRKINLSCAEALNSIFLECIVAPDFDDEALKVFSRKKNLRVLKWKDINLPFKSKELKTIAGGFLVQDCDKVDEFSSDWQVHGESPNKEQIIAINLAWKAVASLKSNAIAISDSKQTLGLGMGQVNRVDAVELALKRAKNLHGENKNFVLASDAFFPFSDSIELAHQYGVKWIVQPGGSIKDEEVLMTAKKNKINMIITGKRHFRH